MAEAILRSWNMPDTAAKVVIDARAGKVLQAEGSVVRDLHSHESTLQWIEMDKPDSTIFDNFDGNETLFRLLTNAPHLGQRILRVDNLTAASYSLSVDGRPLLVHFSAADLAAGIDLSSMPTPMHAQGRTVFYACSDSDALQIARIRAISRVTELPANTPIKEGTLFLDHVSTQPNISLLPRPRRRITPFSFSLSLKRPPAPCSLNKPAL